MGKTKFELFLMAINSSFTDFSKESIVTKFAIFHIGGIIYFYIFAECTFKL